MATELNEFLSRIQNLEDVVLKTKLPVAESGHERSISRVIFDMENDVWTLVDDPPIKTSGQDSRTLRTQSLEQSWTRK